MKRLFIVLALVVMASIITNAQTNNVFWAARVKVKLDKKLEYEKKIPAFLSTHYPQLKFRVYEILTGEHTGSYVYVVGPFSYKDLDAPKVFPKGEALLKSEAQAINALSEEVEVWYARRQDDISDINPDRKIKYLEVTSYELIPGQWSRMRDILREGKEARKLAGSKADISIFKFSSSGLNNSFSSIRYFEKMEDLDLVEDLATPYNKTKGAGAFERRVQEYYSLIRNSTVELRVLREDLSTK